MTTRTRADDFLEVVQRARRGGLKLYIGFAAGVGKTYRMLEEARALKQRGVDVVLGFIETHGRAETLALVDGLEVIPRRRIEYRGVPLEEMDLEAILARRPEVCIVDEIPHTDVPGGKNKRRYQDVIDILAAGINVIGALNIQHLESLKDVVEKASGVPIRETVPDSFLKEAVQVVNLDLAVEDLLERLRSGKIYASDKVERQSETRARVSNGDARSPAAHGRVMVCMSSFPPHGEVLLRKGSRMAGRLSGDWFVAYVETPREAPDRIDAEAQRHLLANIELARELGAEVVRLHAHDPVHAIIDFARSHGVGHVVIGRSQQPRWRQLLGRAVPLRLLAEASDLDVYIVTVTEPEPRS